MTRRGPTPYFDHTGLAQPRGSPRCTNRLCLVDITTELLGPSAHAHCPDHRPPPSRPGEVSQPPLHEVGDFTSIAAEAQGPPEHRPVGHVGPVLGVLGLQVRTDQQLGVVGVQLVSQPPQVEPLVCPAQPDRSGRATRLVTRIGPGTPLSLHRGGSRQPARTPKLGVLESHRVQRRSRLSPAINSAPR